MVNSLYRFSEVEAKTAKPMAIQNIIETILRNDDDACYVEMEAYLRGARNTGSSQFDHAHAVRILKEHDKTHGGLLHVAINENEMSEREVWDRLQRVLIKAGFRFNNGKLTGLMLEDKTDVSDEQPVAQAV